MSKTPWNFVDITGQKFGRLSVVRRSERVYAGGVLWDCVCECGGTATTTSSRLNTGLAKSCGCLAREKNTVHGKCKTKEYLVWQQMRERCNNPKKGSFQRYGARGIKVCPEWDHAGGFVPFLEHLGACPEGHTLDRIDNDKGYEPGNVRWTDNATQYRNRRQTVWITIGEETLCRKDWCSRYGMDEATVAARLTRGWSAERAIKTPAQKQKGKNCPRD